METTTTTTVADERVTVFGANNGNGRNVGFEALGARGVVFSSSPEGDDAAKALAEAVVDAASTLAAHKAEVAAMKAENDTLRVALREARDLRTVAETALASAISGTRRFFGPVLLVAEATGWGGAVWLQDPQKKSHGLGLRFDSLQTLREAHPELWPIGHCADGVLMDAVALKVQS